MNFQANCCHHVVCAGLHTMILLTTLLQSSLQWMYFLLMAIGIEGCKLESEMRCLHQFKAIDNGNMMVKSELIACSWHFAIYLAMHQFSECALRWLDLRRFCYNMEQS